MADFEAAYERTMQAEGGYVLHEVDGDRGGMTYAGIARKMNPQWAGWQYIDAGQVPPTSLVREFYREGWWQPIQGDRIVSQRIAESVYDFAVNTSAFGRPMVAVKLAQLVVGATPDGVVGDRTLAALNAADPALFEARYCIAKIARYRDIVRRDRTQAKFLLGWLNRALQGVA